jgi:hypothetical protein
MAASALRVENVRLQAADTSLRSMKGGRDPSGVENRAYAGAAG